MFISVVRNSSNSSSSGTDRTDDEGAGDLSERGLLQAERRASAGLRRYNADGTTKHWTGGRLALAGLALALMGLLALVFAKPDIASSDSNGSSSGSGAKTRSSLYSITNPLPTFTNPLPSFLASSLFTPPTPSSHRIQYQPYQGLLRGVSFSQYPHLLSARAVSTSSVSGYSLHPDFNRFLYRDLGKPSIALTPGPERDNGTLLRNTMVMAERHDGPGCIDSAFFAFTAGCDKPYDDMSFKVERMQLWPRSSANSSTSTGPPQWETAMEVTFRHFTSPPPPIRWFGADSGSSAVHASAGCPYHSGVYFDAPICFAAGERMRVSAVWDAVDDDKVWRAIFDCMLLGVPCPLGLYFNLWMTSSALHDNVVLPLPLPSSSSSPPLPSTPPPLPRGVESFDSTRSPIEVRKHFVLDQPGNVHPAFIIDDSDDPAKFDFQSHSQQVLDALGSNFTATLDGSQMEEAILAAATAATAAASTHWRRGSHAVSAAGGGALTTLFSHELSETEVEAGGAVLTLLKVSTAALASSLLNWRGLDLVVLWDSGDTTSSLSPFPGRASSTVHAEMHTLRGSLSPPPVGRPQIDVPFSMLFGMGSSSGQEMRATASTVIRYTESVNGSSGALLYPMPFWRSVHILVRNRMEQPVSLSLTVCGRTDVHYDERMTGHLYGHYFYGQQYMGPNHVSANSSFDILDPAIVPHWAEVNGRSNECHITETDFANKHRFQPSDDRRTRADWLSDKMWSDTCGHNPYYPRGSFAYEEYGGPVGEWHMHAGYNLTGHALHWSVQFTSKVKAVI